MIITCEACNTSFNLDNKMLKPTGSKVRCSVCANVFTAFPQQEPTPEPVAEPPEPELAPETGDMSDSVLAAAAAGDAKPSEVDAPEEDLDARFDGDADLDFALEDEPDDDMSDVEIEDAVSDVLDDVQTDFPAEPPVDDESGATVIASLDDDDFNLDLSPEISDEDDTATIIASLDDDLDLSLDEQPDVAETVIADLDQENFDLDIPPEADGDMEATATVIASLDDDFSLDAESPVEAPAETLDDLEDLDLSLDIEPEDAGQPSEAAESPLDELSLDFDLEPDADTDEPEPVAESTDTAVDDLDLTLDLGDLDEGEAEPAAELPELEDDLDLSSLESLLSDDEDGDDDTVTMVVDAGETSELVLDMGDEPTQDEDDGAAVPEETLEDLEFNLDADGGDETVDIDVADDGEQEIDLSEIEKMLEEPETEGADLSTIPEQDLDLDIEASLETEKWMSESGDDSTLVKDEELDLSELEQVLDDVDTEESDEPLEEPELDLDLDLGDGEGLGTSTETVAIDNELDFDLSDFEDDASSKAASGAAIRESADMELEFEVETDSHVEQTLEDEGLAETVAIPEPKTEATEKAPAAPIDTPKPAAAPKPVKKGMSKSLVFLLIIAILGGGAYGTYYLLNQNGIEIPFLSDYLKPKVVDPGNLKLTTYDINSKFIDNASVGKLFVVSGKVKNGYTENRGMITLLGKLFSTGKVAVNQERVYCGNIMSDLELANLEWDKIKARLSNRLGDNRTNVKIEPGKSIPFMVVFSGLPDDLEEFTIEVTGSTTLK